jgi:hypothetical protein
MKIAAPLMCLVTLITPACRHEVGPRESTDDSIDADGGPSGDAGEAHALPDGGPGDGAAPSGDYVAGSRLEPIFFHDGAGARLFSHFVDHGRHDAACTFVSVLNDADELVYACLAEGFFDNAFADADCSHRVAWVANDTRRDFVVEGDEAGCKRGYRVYRVGQAVALRRIYTLEGDACVGYDVPEDALGTGAMHEVTGPVTPDELVYAERVEVPDEASPLRVAYLRGSDGSEAVISAWLGGSPCRANLEGGERWRCFPADYALHDGTFSDAQCGAPLALAPLDECDRPAAIAVTVARDADGNEQRTPHRLGERFDGTVYQLEGAMCAPQLPPVSSSTAAYHVGAVVPWSEFPELSRPRSGTGQLRTNELRTAGGRGLPARTLFDTELGEECAPEQSGPDAYRCVPSSARISRDDYADPQCTVPAALRYDLEDDSKYLYAIGRFEPEGVVARLFRVETAVGTVFYKSAAGCQPLTQQPEEHYLAGEELPLDTLAPLTLGPSP